MGRISAWLELIAAVERFYPKVSERGRGPAMSPKRMMGNHALQLCPTLSGPVIQELLYDSATMRRFF